jgi:prepilin-type N-terminal cleavage/methylation domain-containing protein
MDIKKASKRNSGFTLIEILIASTLFVVIGSATYLAFQKVRCVAMLYRLLKGR